MGVKQELAEGSSKKSQRALKNGAGLGVACATKRTWCDGMDSKEPGSKQSGAGSCGPNRSLGHIPGR